MVKVVKAYYGDEKGLRDVTTSILKKVTGRVLDLTADESLIPAFEAVTKSSLDPQDQKKIRDESIRACGGEADQACIERQRGILTDQRLLEKQNDPSVMPTIKGPKLMLEVQDNEGNSKKYYAGKGQKFRLEDVSSSAANSMEMPTTQDIADKVWILIGAIFAMFFYVFGVAATYSIFMRQYEQTGVDKWRMIAYVTTGLAALIPYSGYMIILLYFGFRSFVDEYVAK